MSFKIRNAEGLFSTGGVPPRWTKVGKVWNKRGHLINHLNLLLECGKAISAYGGTEEIVEYEIVEREIERDFVGDVIAELDDRKQKEKAVRKRQYAESRLRGAIKALEAATEQMQRIAEEN